MTSKKKPAKTTAKKVTAKKVTATAKNSISYKMVGRNVITVIDGQKMTKVIPDKEEKKAFISQIDAYNARNSKVKLKAIIKYLLADKVTVKEKVAKASKLVKDVVVTKPKEEAPALDEIALAKKLLTEQGYVVSKQSPKDKQRRGEY